MRSCSGCEVQPSATRCRESQQAWQRGGFTSNYAPFEPARLLQEQEWRGLGVQQSRGWVHYAVHRPEQHILLFRRPNGTDPTTGLVAGKRIDPTTGKVL